MTSWNTNRNVQVGQLIRLLLYTGARKREILDARWDEIDFSRWMLTVPAARSKSKKPPVPPRTHCWGYFQNAYAMVLPRGVKPCTNGL